MTGTQTTCNVWEEDQERKQHSALCNTDSTVSQFNRLTQI